MNRILLVDDEQNVLNALRRELQDKYDVVTISSPADALNLCSETAFDLVIADYLMPDMNGVQFLKRFAEIQPNAARLVLSGHADIQGLLGAINETHIYRFISKPWEKAELKSAIDQALNYSSILKENRRLAEIYRNSSLAAETRSPDHSYRYHVAVVHGEEAILGLIRNGLVPGAGHEAEKNALWHEISRDSSATPAKVEFQVDTFTSGKKALDQALSVNYDLVMAAQTLPDMSGIDFLRKWIQTQPDSVRILMGNLEDEQLLMQAINEAQIYCFLDFDWENHELKADTRRRVWYLHRMQSSIMEALATRELEQESARMAKEIREFGR